jgi:ADP-ribosylglycohydrolase
LPSSTKNPGWVKIAFSLAIFYLKKNFGFLEAIKDLLSKGGDTDTNACIVGGILGVLHGFK